MLNEGVVEDRSIIRLQTYKKKKYKNLLRFEKYCIKKKTVFPFSEDQRSTYCICYVSFHECCILEMTL